MKDFFRTAAAAGLALLAVSCAKDDPGQENPAPGTGREVEVNLNYSVQALAAGDTETLSALQTRVAPTDLLPTDGQYIPVKNMFIIQFAGNQSSSKMLGAPRFLSSDDLSAVPLTVPLIETNSECYTLFVANVAEGKEYNWNLSTQSTFTDVMKRVKRISKEDDTFETIGGTKTLLLSAVTTNAVNGLTPLEPEFTRNVAKVTLNLTLANDEMEILSVRLRNVSTSVAYADAALTKTGVGSTTPYPADVTVMDYDAVTTGMPTDGVQKSFTWYVPRNQRGENTLSGGYEEKSFYAPTAATYFEIVAVKKPDGGAATSTCVFRVYPGANQENDYNLTPNKHYTIGLKVTGDGSDAYDSRVETFESKSFLVSGATSNSFILNPAPAGGATITYDIPISQVNRYWKGTADGYGNEPANMIGDSDTWKVELIWCDTENLFYNSYNPSFICLTNNNNNNTGVVGTGTGPDQYFQLSVPAGMPAGNFTLGLKKPGSDILWSWHFWVTDYNPGKFNHSMITEGRYTYPVPGGQVERYADNGTDLWASGYANSVMMDRSLGAVEDYFTTQPTSSKRGFLCYQFGRKDPFPATIALGKNDVERKDVGGEITVGLSVNTPYIFYYRATGGSWCSEAKDAGNWNDPLAVSEKSIYDPCPPGWRMPVDGTWSDFNRTSDDGSFITVKNSLRDLAWGYGRNIGSVTTPVNGLRYWPGTSATDPAEGRIWYPAAGYRNSASGHVGTNGTHGYYWSATPYEKAYARYLYFNSNVVSPPATTYPAAGFSVRCISEPLQLQP